MPITFRKSIRIFPGVRLNLNGKSVSFTFGFRSGLKRTYSSTGRVTTSCDLPGPLGWRHTRRRRRGN
ncbi:DUF4236 domain-containing protein [Streptomyces violaceusniger]|uniref:DUF4236 domain-containing protein n=1 Tax=Streptomyces violaceusniger TaxID=68280 RepID=UPI0036C2D606